MRIFVIKRGDSLHSFNWRVGPVHSCVFHGSCYYPGRKQSDGWSFPSVVNSNRDRLHITRSGSFVPDVFGTPYRFVVSERVRQALAVLPGVEFTEVVFEQLVDMPMPPLGDFSWFDRDDLAEYDSLPENLMKSLPDVPEFHSRIGPYWALLPAIHSQVKDRFPDIIEVPVNFGHYICLSAPESVEVSPRLLELYPAVLARGIAFREDAFRLIAPFLDLNHYAIAATSFGEESVWPRINPFDLEPESPEK